MGKTLVICEKPDQAKTYAAILGQPKPGQGFVTVAERTFTWCIGHLFEEQKPDELNEAWSGSWNLDQLPMLPEKIGLKVAEGKAHQWAVVRKLLSDSSFSAVVNACDAGREGELIFQECYHKAGCKLPVLRLWVSDYTPEAVRRAFNNLKPGSDYAGLTAAAFARAELDYILGMNFTRLFTVKTGDRITVGRVQTPTLGILVQREEDIENFQPRAFWTVRIEFGDKGLARWHKAPDYKESRLWEEADARALVTRCRKESSARVLEVTGEEGKTAAPLCFDLASLQMEMNRRHGMTADQTLKTAQALYERHKLITYPRTGSAYLSTELFNDLGKHLDALAGEYGELVQGAKDRLAAGPKAFRVVNDSKITDHHAIIPTAKEARYPELSEDERRVYDAVARRLLAALLPPATFKSSVAWLEIAEERFKAEGKVFTSKGWLEAEPWRVALDNPMPSLEAGQEIAVQKVILADDQTKPPSRFTEATLLAAMVAAGKSIEDEELSKALAAAEGLGTPATRADQIENLIRRQYVERKGKNLIPTARGRELFKLVRSLCPEVCSPELSGKMEKELNEIETGKAKRADFRLRAAKFIKEVVNIVAAAEISYTPQEGAEKGRSNALCKCSKCGGDIFESPKGYGCSNWNREENPCKAVVWKNFRGKKITRAQAVALHEKGRTSRPLTFEKSDGSGTYTAYIVLAEDGKMGVEFPGINRKRGAKPRRRHSK